MSTTTIILVKLQPLEGYLRYKMITSQNVSFEAQVKNFFISYKIYVPFSGVFPSTFLQPVNGKKKTQS